MTDTVDLRDRPPERHRTHLFETLADAAPGDAFDVVAPDDVDAHLHRYQVEHDRALDWTYADPDAEPRELRVTVAGSLDGARGTLDVRDLRPARRHAVLLDVFDGLAPGEGFVLVNDHDPKPLYHELRSIHGPVVDWTYADRGSGACRVEVGRRGDADAGETPTPDDVAARYDLRDVPEAERDSTVHHRFETIPAGETMELVAAAEPRALRRTFRQRYGDSVDWTVAASDADRCRVRITKRDGDAAGEGGESDPTGADGATVDVVDELDVRSLPPAQRHDRIFAAYDELGPGEGFVLVNDHDPKPLYHQFDAEAGPEFTWRYRRRAAGEFRVLVGKDETAVGEAADARR